ncbi:MAG: hypothetical protein FWD83_00335 [Promicromonosporaceae bacterium]|nr:hypothetical protein [Promicromonosporaceae bacterium]
MTAWFDVPLFSLPTAGGGGVLGGYAKTPARGEGSAERSSQSLGLVARDYTIFDSEFNTYQQEPGVRYEHSGRS